MMLLLLLLCCRSVVGSDVLRARPCRPQLRDVRASMSRLSLNADDVTIGRLRIESAADSAMSKIRRTPNMPKTKIGRNPKFTPYGRNST